MKEKIEVKATRDFMAKMNEAKKLRNSVFENTSDSVGLTKENKPDIVRHRKSKKKIKKE